MSKPELLIVTTDLNWFPEDARRAKAAHDQDQEAFAKELQANSDRAHTGFCGSAGYLGDYGGGERVGEFVQRLQEYRAGDLRPFVDLTRFGPQVFYRSFQVGGMLPSDDPGHYQQLLDAMLVRGEFADMQGRPMNQKPHIDLVVSYVSNGDFYAPLVNRLAQDFDVRKVDITDAF